MPYNTATLSVAAGAAGWREWGAGRSRGEWGRSGLLRHCLAVAGGGVDVIQTVHGVKLTEVRTLVTMTPLLGVCRTNLYVTVCVHVDRH